MKKIKWYERLFVGLLLLGFATLIYHVTTYKGEDIKNVSAISKTIPPRK